MRTKVFRIEEMFSESYYVFGLIGTAIVIYIICFLVDIVRLQLEQIVFRYINKIAGKQMQKFDDWINIS